MEEHTPPIADRKTDGKKTKFQTKHKLDRSLRTMVAAREDLKAGLREHTLRTEMRTQLVKAPGQRIRCLAHHYERGPLG